MSIKYEDVDKKKINSKEYFFTVCLFKNNLKLCAKLSPTIKEIFDFILNENKIIITGDTRFDQIIDRYKSNKNKNYLPDNFLKSFNTRKSHRSNNSIYNFCERSFIFISRNLMRYLHSVNG